MAFPASQQLLVNGLEQARTHALSLQRSVQQLHDDSLAGSVARDRLIGIMGMLAEAVTVWTDIATLSGMAQYARDQYDDQALDVVAEFTAMNAAAVVLRDWVFTNYPTGTGGSWLTYSFDNSGVRTVLTFSTAQLVDFRTEAATFLATIS